ncbi:hypothetical protein HOD08_03225 [bacterium]|jgi:hypothetical protein|nr:hypothetical protein [bacterium]
MERFLWIVCDGVSNSVFKSQVCAPLIKWLDEDESRTAALVTFERQPKDVDLKNLPGHSRLEYFVERSYPFFGRWTLWGAVLKFRKVVERFSPTMIVARGPLAGYVAMKAKVKSNLVVQARGLCAEEYRFTHSRGSKLKWTMRKPFVWMLKQLEKKVYRSNAIKIETVSPALRDYLCDSFGARAGNIDVADFDIPNPISKDQVKTWREEGRSHFGIPADAIVYCYSGSAKPWQCAEETIQFFSEKLKAEPQVHFVVFTGATGEFTKLAEKYGIPKEKILIMRVEPSELLRHLAIADFGVILREKDPVNWVSRPTKVLEYRAVGMGLVHNGTVDWINNLEIL